MKLAALSVALVFAALVPPAASAQFVNGNEAVRVTASGKVVDTPAPPSSASKPCAASAKCHAGAWRMVETASGLVECTEPWARPGTCRRSTYGSDKLRRVWVVRRNGEWLQCQYPRLDSVCAPLSARPPANLPVDALQ